MLSPQIINAVNNVIQIFLYTKQISIAIHSDATTSDT